MSVFETGVRPAIDAYLLKKSEEKRDYGEYWSASSAGYCMRKIMFERLGVPYANEDARKTRVFESGHIFHSWLQGITKNAGLSVVQELELQDEELMIRGHIDDLILIEKNYILYDYKTQNSRAFHWQKKNGSNLSYYHKMQLGTYMMMLKKAAQPWNKVKEARILKISKDDLSMAEDVLMWSDELEAEIMGFWQTLNKYWTERKMPACTCADHEGGFMSRAQYNPFYFNEQPCSLDWFRKWKSEQEVKLMGQDSSDRFKA